MKNKKYIQLIFAIVLVIGFALCLNKGTRLFGLLLLSIVQPFIALYYISLFKREESATNRELKLRVLLIISLQITFVLLPIKYLFMTMHWPFGAIFNLFLFIFTITNLILGIAFIVINRKIIQSVFIFEFIILTIPIFLFLGVHNRIDYSRFEYSTMLTKQYINLCEIQKSLYLKVQKDTLIDFTEIAILEKMKNETIMRSGGMNENSELVGGLQKVDTFENRFIIRKLKNDSIVSIINKEPTIVLEYLNTLTKIQIDLLIKAQQ